ncbi:hypothetical protein D9V96_020385 [Zobellia laminariae]|uniref:hypothetical protein n=1 Tax=Zobellia laminariae TaxID=248906 RepID=UPI0012D88010
MYKQITTSADSDIIGVNNGLYQLEFKEKELKKSLNYEVIKDVLLNFDVNNFLKNQDSIQKTETSILTAHLLKKAKLTDIMTFAPYFFGYKYVVSEKFVNCLSNVANTREEYHLREINIKGIDEKYYLLFIQMIPSSEINFSKSLFYSENIGGIDNKNYLQISDYGEYSKQIKETPFIKWERIVLNKEYEDRKIISLQASTELFFSNILIYVLKKNDVSNFIVREGCELVFY